MALALPIAAQLGASPGIVAAGVMITGASSPYLLLLLLISSPYLVLLLLISSPYLLLLLLISSPYLLLLISSKWVRRGCQSHVSALYESSSQR